MNFITRMPPATPQGNLEFRGGNLNYFNTHFDYGGTWGKSGYLADITHFQSQSPRFINNRVTVDDVTFKAVQELTDRTTLLTKFNYYGEESKLGYQGLTEAEWGSAAAVIGTHRSPMTNWILSVWACMWLCNTCSMPTSRRRQISSVIGLNEIGNGHSSKELTRMEIQLVAPVAGNNIPATSFGVVPSPNFSFTNAREYFVYGVEPRFHLTHRLFGIANEADFGARYMYEHSDRKQFNNFLSGAGGTNTCFNPFRQFLFE